MAQIIKHRRGSLEGLSAVTSSVQKGELLIATGSSNLTTVNGASLVFAAAADGQIQAVNRFLQGNSVPNAFSNASYNGLVNGVPYYHSGSATLYLLGSDANTAINLEGNIQPFSASVSSSIAALSASVGGGAGVSITNLNTFSGSVLTRLTEIGVVSGSLIASASTAKTTNDSQDVSITNINSFSSSANTRFTEIGVVSGSLISSASAAAVANANLNTFSSSVLTRLTEIGVVSGSLINSASNAAGRLTNIEAFSSSFDTAFNLSGTNVTIAGNLTVQGTTTQVDSTTIQLGDNIIELNGTGVANGGLLVKDPTAPNTVSGSLLWDSTNDYWKAGAAGAESKLLRADGDGVVSGSSQITLSSTTGFSNFNTALSTITGSLISSASAAKTTNDAQDVSITNINTFSGSVLTRLIEVGVVSGSLITSASTAKTTNDSQDVSITNINTFSSSVLTRLTEIGVVSGSLISSASAASISIAALNSYTSSNTSTNALNSYTASAETRFTQIGVVSGSLISSASAASVSITNLNSFSGSQLTQNSTLATYTGSVNTRLTEVGVVSGSLITSASNAASRLTTLEGTGTIQGLGTSNNVTFAKVTTSGDVVVGGDLVVQGNTVTLNTATLIVEDKLITLASGSTSSATADGAGIEIAGAGANFVYQHSTLAFTSSVALIAPAVTASVNLGSSAGSSKRIAFRNTNGNLDLVPTGSVSGDLLQWNGTDFIMSNTIDGGSF